jgi:pyridoxal phosphate enzyme (YggS family)
MIGSYSYIEQNLTEIRQRIADSAKKTNKNPNEITLIAVSKTFEQDAIRAAYDYGVKDFGESYVQEAILKVDSLNIGATWHFIGHLQKNKVRPVVTRFNIIQSVDSVDLLNRLDRIAGEENKNIEALIQVNIAEENRKSGIKSSNVVSLLREAEICQHVKIKGLMLIPPFFENPEDNRRNFSNLRELSEELNSMNFLNWENRFLSMGMTDDFEIAIEEGSNMIRIGRAIFGPRGRQ